MLNLIMLLTLTTSAFTLGGKPEAKAQENDEIQHKLESIQVEMVEVSTKKRKV